MGIYCSVHRVGADELERLAHDAEARSQLIGADPAALPTLVAVRPPGCLGLLLRALPITVSEPAPLPGRSGPGGTGVSGPDGSDPGNVDPDRTLDLEKSWHGLHYLLTGAAEGGPEPGCFLLSGGETLDDEGWLRALSPAAVRQWSEYLDALSATELATRYDPVLMSELDVYPGVWARGTEDSQALLPWLLASFENLRAFVRNAAAANDALVVVLA